MSQIVSMTGPISSLRAQLRAQAEAALAPETKSTLFVDRMGGALKEVANAQNDAANLTKAYELGTENDISKVMISQQVSSLGCQLTLNVRNKMLSAYACYTSQKNVWPTCISTLFADYCRDCGCCFWAWILPLGPTTNKNNVICRAA